MTRAAMADCSISVVIPARNEAAAIGPVIDQARAGRPLEIIVVDGGSTDGTPSVARMHGASVVTEEAGRGRQLNRGAAAASGDVLLFLHADTLLPDGFERHVRTTLRRRGVSAGAFRLRIDGRRTGLRLIERAATWRSRILRMPYGDQAIFVTRAMFDRAGGFPSHAVMEDYELVRRLRRLGRIEIAPSAVTTSARRWLACGIWRTTLLNQACVLAYRLGVPTARIARWRADADPGGRAPHGARWNSICKGSRPEAAVNSSRNES